MDINILSHNDLDACGTIILLKLIFREHIKKVKFCNYDNIDKEIREFLNDPKLKNKTNQYLFITDICPSNNTLKQLHKRHDFTYQLIDHHKTKEKFLKQYSWAYFNKDYSATMLTYQWLLDQDKFDLGAALHKKALAFSKACNDYDMWNLSGEDRERGERLNLLLSFIGKEKFVDIFCNNLEADQLDFYKQILEYLEKNKQDYVTKTVKQLRKTINNMDGFGNTFKVLFASEYISEVGHAALADGDSEDLHYIVIVNPLTNTVSFRAREEDTIDVSIIAKRLGGGGHKAAAGAIINLKNGLQNKITKILNMVDG